MLPVRITGDLVSLFRDDGINFATGEKARLNEPYAGIRLFTEAATTFSPFLEEGATLVKAGASFVSTSSKWLMPAAESMSYKFMSKNGLLLNIVPEETWVSGHLRAEIKGFPGVGQTINGGPTFAGTDYLYPAGEGQKNIVNIKLTGSYRRDFALANEQAGFSKIPTVGDTKYTWHHIDDFNPITGRATLELVERDAHKATTPHKGSVQQYKAFYGSGY